MCLSRGENELHGISKGVSVGLGMQSIARDLGLDIAVRIHSDARAAIGIARRRGLGQFKHLVVGYLWVQQKIRDGSVDIVKVFGAENTADILTKYVAVAADRLNKMLSKDRYGVHGWACLSRSRTS